MPVSYDLRDEGKAPKAREQTKLETCWAFAAVGSCESNYMIQGSDSDSDLEPNTLLEAARIFSFTGKGDAFTASAVLSRLNRLQDVYLLSKNHVPDNELIKQLILQHGAVYAGLYFDETQHESYGSFTTYFNDTHGRITNHDVLIIGWDDDFPLFRFTPRASHNGAWLVQNSWGHNKYFWIPYEQPISTGAVFIMGNETSSRQAYYHDELGYCSSLPYDWSANVFKSLNDYESLESASFYTSFNDMSYELYVYELGTTFPDSPINGHLLATLTGNIPLAGYHTVTLPELSLWNGEYFSIVLKLSRKIAPVETRVPGYSDNASVHERESYFSLDGLHWTDGIELDANACIKVFTVMN